MSKNFSRSKMFKKPDYKKRKAITIAFKKYFIDKES